MKMYLKPLLLVLFAVAFYLADFEPGAPLQLVFVGDAHAILGVARRTTRRVVVGTSIVAADSAESQAAAASASAASASASAAAASAAAAPAPAPAAEAFAVGTTVSALPAGCVSTTISGAEYFNCDGTYFKPAFQSNNLVYVVTQP